MINQFPGNKFAANTSYTLRGSTGILTGLLELLASAVLWISLKLWEYSEYFHAFQLSPDKLNLKAVVLWIAMQVAIATAVLLFGRIVSTGSSRGRKVALRALLDSLFIPMATGTLFCVALLYQQYVRLILPGMQLFYGLALVSSGHHLRDSIRYLGMGQIILGLTGVFFPGYGLFFWTAGMGILHIIYGVTRRVV